MSKLLGSTMTTNNTSPEEANNDTIVTSVPLNDGISSLRQRNVNSSGRSSTKRKKKTLKWISSSDNYTLPTPAEAEVFMTMQLRKMRRRVHGRKVKGSMAAECGFLFCMIIIIFVIAVFTAAEVAEDEETTTAPSALDETFNFDHQLVWFVLWVLVAFIILSKAPFNHWMRMLM